MRIFIILYLLSLFYIVNSFAITYSECHQQFLKKKEQVCNGNGKCHIFFGCQCFNGFMGEKCEIKVEKRSGCDLNKCEGGSECIEISASEYYCECPPNRYGSFCEFEYACFDCIGKCIEVAEDVFECDELGRKADRNVLNQTEKNNSTLFYDTVFLPNATTANDTEFIIADSSSSTVSSDIKESKNDDILKYLFYCFVFIIAIAICFCIGKLVVRRWRKISEEIEAENAAIREMYVREATHFTI